MFLHYGNKDLYSQEAIHTTPPKQHNQQVNFPQIIRFSTAVICLLLVMGLAGLYSWQQQPPTVLPIPVVPSVNEQQSNTTIFASKANQPNSANSDISKSNQPSSMQNIQTTHTTALPTSIAAILPVDYTSANELAAAVGFDVRDIKNLPFLIRQVHYQAYGKKLAQITYLNQNRSLIYRKSPGLEDNSGDDSQYPFIWETTQNKRSIVLKGNGMLFHLASWQKYGYSYSLYSTKAMSSKDFIRIILVNEE